MFAVRISALVTLHCHLKFKIVTDCCAEHILGRYSIKTSF